MASIAKRPNGTWRARYRDTHGTEHSRHFSRKIDAQTWLDSVTTAVRTGTYVDPTKSRITVGELAPLWLAGKINLKPTTRARYADVLKTHVLPRWRDISLSRVEYGEIQNWLAELDDRGLAGASVRKAHGVLSGILGLAVKDRRLTSNPALGVALPPLNQKRRRYLTAIQVEEFAAAAGTGRAVVYTLAYCGLRWSELAALRVRNVDLLRRRLNVEEAVTEINGSQLVWGTTKSHERRSVPIPRFLAVELEALLEGKGPDTLLFSSPFGAVLRNRNARSLWFDAAATAIGQAGLTPHELRHTAASLAVSAGANVKAVQRMLGHASAALTLDTYADLFDDDLNDVADRLNVVRENARQNSADFLRTRPEIGERVEGLGSDEGQQTWDLQAVETKRIELSTPALQRRCSAN
jgi:integrase